MKMDQSTLTHDHAPNVASTACRACVAESAMPEYVLGRNRKSRRERADKGFSTEDTWSFDSYLAGVIAGGVAALRDRAEGKPFGCPAALLPDGVTNPTEEQSEKANAEWRGILDKIATGFGSYAQTEDKRDGFEEAFDLLREWWGALWD